MSGQSKDRSSGAAITGVYPEDAVCIECGEVFERESNERWKKRCLTCWIEWQDTRRDPRAHAEAIEIEQKRLLEAKP